MKELDLQEKYIINFLCERPDGLQYKEVKANTVSSQFFIVEDLKHFLSESTLNKDNYRKLLRKNVNEKELLNEFMEELLKRIKSSMNMAIFINSNKTVSFKGQTFYLFYPTGTEFHEDKLFDENIFSVVQDLPVSLKNEGSAKFSFRPDLTFFINGIFLCYNEFKSNYNNQNARDHGRNKIASDYLESVQEYMSIADNNDVTQTIRKDFLRIFEKAIHITSTDINDTYIIRNISNQFDDIKSTIADGSFDFETARKSILFDFKPYPVTSYELTKTQRFEQVFRALYDKRMIEKEILYYNFIERELIKKAGSRTKEYKHNDGRLISPRPKQKFGVDKIMGKINEFLEHESDPDYFIKKLFNDLKAKGLGTAQIEDLIDKRQKYQNNKTVYSLLMQYAAGFGKSNIIGWAALGLKDLRKDGIYVYDKIMLVVDRLQLRDQLDSKMFNMNIQKKMYIEADNQKSFIAALNSDIRIVVVNLQKFTTIKDVLAPEIIKKLAKLRIAFLIDEIHRSNSGVQNEEMISLFDELQSSFDNSKEYKKRQQKKNLIVGFTATPSDITLARYGEYNKYAEAEKIWIPFDSYTMKEAIEDGYILNPLRGIIPVSSKMYFDKPIDELEGFEDDNGYDDIPDNTGTGHGKNGKKYAIRKKLIYENEDRIKAISKFIVERLVSTVYHNIRGKAKAMLAVTSIHAAVRYKKEIDRQYAEIVKLKKYERFKEAPVYVLYSDNQHDQSCSSLNNNLSDEMILQNFMIKKNGLMIVVDKLQTGYDEPRLHTMFLDKEVQGINAIQTISRVNRVTKDKNDCKIIDFSYKNANVNSIKKAFEHFSNVVVSDFDPLGDEAKLEIHFAELKQNTLFKSHFVNFIKANKIPLDVIMLLEIETAFQSYIKTQKDEAKQLKIKLNKYFHILNLIEYIIALDEKYSEPSFLDFWRRYNNEYNTLTKTKDRVDDVSIYFDNKIGITALEEKKDKPKRPGNGGEPPTGGGKYKFNILKVIEKRNREEKAIEALIQDFEHKIQLLFDYINSSDEGTRLIAKIRDDGSAFDQEDIYKDFAMIYRKFKRRNEKTIGEAFFKETQDMTNQLCDDFEKTILVPYPFNNTVNMAAEDNNSF